MESRTIPPPQASARQTEMGETFSRVLVSALDALQESGVPYALIGGIAASGLGRPRPTHDIDIFIRPDDAEAALAALAKHGFDTERTDPGWLYKGWKDGMMVDLIFKSHGDIYFDDEMSERTRMIRYHGRDIPAVSPEDLVIIKAAVHSENGPHHWHDALAVLSHANLDWDYLIKRARRATRRVLALLIYAQSNDIWIPNRVIFDLYNITFGQEPVTPSAPKPKPNGSAQAPRYMPPEAQTSEECELEFTGDRTYLVSLLQERLSSDERTGAADLRVSIEDRKIFIRGETVSREQRDAVEPLVRTLAPGYEVVNEVRVTEIAAPKVEKVL